jgi:hypothetical protein
VVTHYEAVAQQKGSAEALALAARLAAWHDRMVAHERMLGTGSRRRCDEECPHAEAVDFWRAAVESFGEAADRLAFLKRTAAAVQGNHGGLVPRETRPRAAIAGR